jgi:hypothetical protein
MMQDIHAHTGSGADPGVLKTLYKFSLCYTLYFHESKVIFICVKQLVHHNHNISMCMCIRTCILMM